MALIRGWVGGRRAGGWWGWVGNPKRALLETRSQIVVLCPQQMTGMYTNHRIDRDSHWQQPGTKTILISAPQWANRPCNAPTRFYSFGKKPSIKADLAIYNHAVDVSGQYIIESLTLGHIIWILVLETLWSVFVNLVTHHSLGKVNGWKDS